MRSWVKASGSVPEGRLLECVEEYLASRPDGGFDCRCVAFFADRFAGARGAQACRELLADARKLLELRLFDEESELWCHRSLLGREFALRRADDADLAERHRLCSAQTLDVAEELGAGERGCVRLRGTAGSRYELPMNPGERSVRVVSYIDYDGQSGAARVVDYRLAGFAAEKGGVEA